MQIKSQYQGKNDQYIFNLFPLIEGSVPLGSRMDDDGMMTHADDNLHNLTFEYQPVVSKLPPCKPCEHLQIQSLDIKLFTSS